MAILSGELSRFPLTLPLKYPYILFNTIPPCPHTGKRGEGMVVKEEEWRESTFHEGN